MQIDNHTAKMDGLQYVSNIYPIYQKGNVKLINADCMEIMAQYPNKYFDLAVVDPIYGHDLSGGHNSKNGCGDKTFWNKAVNEWNTKKTQPEYFKELFRVSKNQIIWGGNNFTLEGTEGFIIWDKGQRNFSLADAELAWTSYQKATRIFSFSRAKNNKNIRTHPTEKPIELYDFCFNYAKATKDMKVLDTHGGSFSSAIAGYYFGFSEFVACELNTEMYQLSVKRFKEKTLSQLINFDCC